MLDASGNADKKVRKMDWNDSEELRREAAELRLSDEMEAAGYDWDREDCECRFCAEATVEAEDYRRTVDHEFNRSRGV